jgi:putative MATE family efflux protein
MKDLTTGSVIKRISLFAIPMVLGNFFQQLYNIVDSIIIGNYLGKASLAAVGASFPIIFILISVVMGFGSGASVLISQFYGAKKMNSVKLTIETLYIVLITSAIVISIIGYFFIDSLFVLINLPSDVIPLASKYLKVFLLGLVFFFGFNGTTSILRGLGDSKTPLYFLILATFFNIIFDWFFVVVFKWGIASVAWGTIMAQAGAFITAILYLNRTHTVVKLYLLKLRFDLEIFKKILKVGLPSGLQTLIVAIGIFALIWIINSFGTDVIAAYTIAMRIEALASLPAMSFGVALAAFVGQNVGANKLDRVYKGVNSTLYLTLSISIFISLISILFSHTLIAAFTKDPMVIEVGVSYLKIVPYFFVLFSVLFVYNGALRGAGDMIIPMFITLTALWIVRIPAAYFLSFDFGYIGVWYSSPAGWFVGMSLSMGYFYLGRWKKKKLVE